MPIGIEETKDGQILQDTQEIIDSVRVLIDRIFKRHQIDPSQVKAIGITNQEKRLLCGINIPVKFTIK